MSRTGITDWRTGIVLWVNGHNATIYTKRITSIQCIDIHTQANLGAGRYHRINFFLLS